MPAKISSNGLKKALSLEVAYSDKQIALSRPIGTDTHKAIIDIKKVPANNGIAPY